MTTVITRNLEDDIYSIQKSIWCCYKAKSFSRELLSQLLSELGLFTLHNGCAPCSLDYFKLKFESKSRLSTPDILVLTFFLANKRQNGYSEKANFLQLYPQKKCKSLLKNCWFWNPNKKNGGLKSNM